MACVTLVPGSRAERRAEKRSAFRRAVAECAALFRPTSAPAAGLEADAAAGETMCNVDAGIRREDDKMAPAHPSQRVMPSLREMIAQDDEPVFAPLVMVGPDHFVAEHRIGGAY